MLDRDAYSANGLRYVADLIDRIKANEGCRPAVAGRFTGMVADLDVRTLEILEFCMHELRWPEIRDRARAALAGETRVGLTGTDVR